MFKVIVSQSTTIIYGLAPLLTGAETHYYVHLQTKEYVLKVLTVLNTSNNRLIIAWFVSVQLKRLKNAY